MQNLVSPGGQTLPGSNPSGAVHYHATRWQNQSILERALPGCGHIIAKDRALSKGYKWQSLSSLV